MSIQAAKGRASAPRILRLALFFLAAACLPSPLRAATYAAISDAELVRRSPIVVFAEAMEETTRVELIGGSEYPFTFVTLRRLDVLKGAIPEETFLVRLPGGEREVSLPDGEKGEISWWVSGVPRFQPQQRTILFLQPLSDHPGEYLLTELALSKFDLLQDSQRTLFAVRSVFQSGEERLLSVDATQEVAPDEVRDFEAFLAALRIAGQGEALPKTVYRQPKGALRPVTRMITPLWVNIGGREPGGGCRNSAGEEIQCLFRWFWDTGASPTGVVQVVGTQGSLADGSDGVEHVATAISSWTSIPGTDVRYIGPAEGGNVTVNLGVVNDPGGSWTTAYDCTGGTLGVGGPRSASGPRSFKEDTTYYAPRGGNVSIRQWSCPASQPVSTYRTVLVHELGHTLGLGHPDQAASIHSATTEADWQSAVMPSTLRSSIFTPQKDDIEAMLYYYGTPEVPPAPAADFRFSPSNPGVNEPVTFTDNSINSPTSWSWSFGEGGTSSLQNPRYTFSAPGTYAVTLTARNGFSTITNSKAVTVGSPSRACESSVASLCFNRGRFAVTLLSRDPRTERIGAGQAIPQNNIFGYFSLPALTNDAANPEVFVKVLDGRAVNGNFWVFFGGLTDLEYTVTVLDIATRRVKSYTKLAGDNCGGFDTAAFPGAGLAAPSLPSAADPVLAKASRGLGHLGCPSANPAGLCLTSSRSFEVSLSAHDPRTGNTGGGQPIPQNNLFGYFSIPALTGDAENPEVFVKVIDGSPVNGKHWVFYGGPVKPSKKVTREGIVEPSRM